MPAEALGPGPNTPPRAADSARPRRSRAAPAPEGPGQRPPPTVPDSAGARGSRAEHASDGPGPRPPATAPDRTRLRWSRAAPASDGPDGARPRRSRTDSRGVNVVEAGGTRAAAGPAPVSVIRSWGERWGCRGRQRSSGDARRDAETCHHRRPAGSTLPGASPPDRLARFRSAATGRSGWTAAHRDQRATGSGQMRHETNVCHGRPAREPREGQRPCRDASPDENLAGSGPGRPRRWHRGMRVAPNCPMPGQRRAARAEPPSVPRAERRATGGAASRAGVRATTRADAAAGSARQSSAAARPSSAAARSPRQPCHPIDPGDPCDSARPTPDPAEPDRASRAPVRSPSARLPGPRTPSSRPASGDRSSRAPHAHQEQPRDRRRPGVPQPGTQPPASHREGGRP